MVTPSGTVDKCDELRKSSIMSLKIIVLQGTMLVTGQILMAATAPVGVVQTAGDFRLNQTTGLANSTVFEGALLETGYYPSTVALASGGRVVVGPHSRTRIYSSYAVLEAGAMDASSAGFTVKASRLSVSGVSQLKMDSASRVSVGAATTTPVEVRSGVQLIARVFPNQPLEFNLGSPDPAPQGTAPSGPVNITGTLEKTPDGKYKVTDATTHVTYEVQGKDLDKKVGKKVKLAGTVVGGAAAVAGATAVVTATSVAVVAAGAAAAAGLGTAAIAGIVVGGGAAAGLGIAAGTGAFNSSN